VNVIVFSKSLGRSLQFELGGRASLIAAGAVALGVLGLVFYVGLHFGARGLLMEPTARVLQWSGQVEHQRAEVTDSKRSIEDTLDALALRVGQINAHMIRLDALGRRLTDMANLKKGEFNFDVPPAQGGPELTPAQAALAVPQLSASVDALASQVKDRERQLGVLESLISARNFNRQMMPSGRPVADGYISSYFGGRTDPFDGHEAFHQGLDFAGAEGSKVTAVAAGIVVWAQDRSGYGRMVEINHGNGYVTRYAHCEKALVAVGDTVKKGQAIALIGSTGRSTGPHLHFEVLRDGRAVNPLTFVGKAG